MQAVTLAIGKAGIDFFAQHYLVSQLLELVKKLNPPDKTIPIQDFSINSATSSDDYTRIRVALSKGSLSNFSPAFQKVVQGTNGVFSLTFVANRFQVNYQWRETYNRRLCINSRIGRNCADSDQSNQWPCTPQVGSLSIAVGIAFTYNSDKKQWDMTAGKIAADAPNVQTNLPSDSILLQKPSVCASDHVTQVVTDAIDSIDFNTPINQLIKGVVGSIPGSGDLGNGIVYDFTMGDSGAVFPDNKGIQMGVKGGASYNSEVFSEKPEPSLPLPLPPADNDTHHLNLYVANYEVDALYWAFFKAGRLDLVVNPQDLPNPSALYVSSYASWDQSLAPYSNYVMQAQISQHAAPLTSFQEAYLYHDAQMAVLKAQLPADVYQRIERLPGNAFLTLNDLQAFLTTAKVPSNYFAQIAEVGKTPAMAVTQDLIFNLVIQAGDNPNPYIKFSVKRTDVMTGLKLGLSADKKAQTMQFGFSNANNAATFLDSSVPGFTGGLDFGGPLWHVTAEGLYADNLDKLGKTGVPLPIMQGFQFDFDNAQLSVQEGYVSILANVAYHQTS